MYGFGSCSLVVQIVACKVFWSHCENIFFYTEFLINAQWYTVQYAVSFRHPDIWMRCTPFRSYFNFEWSLCTWIIKHKKQRGEKNTYRLWRWQEDSQQVLKHDRKKQIWDTGGELTDPMPTNIHLVILSQLRHDSHRQLCVQRFCSDNWSARRSLLF